MESESRAPGEAADVLWQAAADEVLGEVERGEAAQATQHADRDRAQAVAGHVQRQQPGSCREAARQLRQRVVAGVHLAHFKAALLVMFVHKILEDIIGLLTAVCSAGLGWIGLSRSPTRHNC